MGSIKNNIDNDVSYNVRYVIGFVNNSNNFYFKNNKDASDAAVVQHSTLNIKPNIPSNHSQNVINKTYNTIQTTTVNVLSEH